MAAESRYDHMEYRRCGNSGIQLPLVSLGLWQNWGKEDSSSNATDMILTAFDLGITHFDLANNYGPPRGAAEETFGKILKKDLQHHRDEILISTKAGHLMWDGPYGTWGSKKHLIASLDQSLKRLNIDYVDIFYHHRPDLDTPMEETMSALDQIVRSGKALYVGISRYNPEQTRQAQSILRNLGTPCLIHQPRYNLLDRDIENGLIQTLKDESIGCIVYSPLAQGLLTSKYLKSVPKGSRASKGVRSLSPNQITKELKNAINALNHLAEKKELSLAQMAINWILRFPQITSALIGASHPNQIKELVAGLEKRQFSKEDLEEIDRILDKSA